MQELFKHEEKKDFAWCPHFVGVNSTPRELHSSDLNVPSR